MAHRLFVAHRPPKDIRAALLGAMDGVAKARWRDEGQLHLTLRYIGEVETPMANDLAAALGRLLIAPFALRIAGVGHFERKGLPHTLWAGIARSPELTRLQRRVELCVAATGPPPETRKFMPHITLARLNSSSGSIAAFLTAQARLATPDWTMDSLTLYESHLSPSGSRYEPVVRYGYEQG